MVRARKRCCTLLALVVGVAVGVQIQQPQELGAGHIRQQPQRLAELVAGQSVAGGDREHNCNRRGRGDLPAEDVSLLDDSSFSLASRKPHNVTKPKLALLMVVRGRVFNEQVWLEWIHSAQKDGLSFKLVIHTDMEFNARSGFNSALKEYLFPQQVPTLHCDVVDAAFLLIDTIRREDKDVTHFAMVSDNSVPVKPLRAMYQSLQKDPANRFCVDTGTQPPRAETWWLIRKEDASRYSRLQRAPRFIQYLGALRAYHACVDEMLWYVGFKELKAPILEECVMFTEWPECKTNWPHYSPAWMPDQFPKLRAGERTPPEVFAPATFLNVSAAAFRELLTSSFWFARKFADGAIGPEAVALAAAAWAPR